MKTKTIELFDFSELSESAKAKVLQEQRDINTDYDWYKWSLEDWERDLESMGFDDVNISFSGFWSQGDGASFTSGSIDIEKFLTAQKAKGRFKAILKAIKANKAEFITSIDRIDHHYSHEYTVRAYVEYNSLEDKFTPNQDQANELESFLTDTVRTLSRKIYRELEKEHEHLTTDAAIIDTIEANEYTFTASGKMKNI